MRELISFLVPLGGPDVQRTCYDLFPHRGRRAQPLGRRGGAMTRLLRLWRLPGNGANLSAKRPGVEADPASSSGQSPAARIRSFLQYWESLSEQIAYGVKTIAS